MAQGHGSEFWPGRPGQALPSADIVRDLAEDPRVTERAPPDHHPVAAGFGQHPRRVLGRFHVAVAEHRDIDRFLDPPDLRPIRLTRETLLRSAGMDGNRPDADLFRRLGKLYRR